MMVKKVRSDLLARYEGCKGCTAKCQYNSPLVATKEQAARIKHMNCNNSVDFKLKVVDFNLKVSDLMGSIR